MIDLGPLGLMVTFIIGLMVVGAWLERINGVHGIVDELLTPLPMGVFGMLVLFERAWI